MNIKVKDEKLGECNVNIYVDIDKDSKYLIKSLCALQLLCMNSAEDKDKHREFVELLKETANKADKIFGESADEVNISATESFD
jgi:thiaminase